MTEEDIWDAIASHGKAAENAKRAGFDGVEAHAANGYLIEQFAASNTNLRTDGWGGSLQNRVRFMSEVLKAMAKVYGAGKVGVRLSPYGRFNDINDENPQAMYEAMLRVAEQSGVRYVHIIRPRVSGDEDRTASQADTDVVATARRLFSRTVIAAGGFSPDSAEAELVSGRADLIAFGRPFIGNPDFVKRLRQNVPLSAFDPATLYTIGPRGYTDYPTAT
jgi:N-ethylmaleimide reductase